MLGLPALVGFWGSWAPGASFHYPMVQTLLGASWSSWLKKCPDMRPAQERVRPSRAPGVMRPARERVRPSRAPSGSDEQPIQKRQRRQADQPFEPIRIYVQSGMSGRDLGEFLVNACDPAEQLLAKLVSKHPTLPYGILCIGTRVVEWGKSLHESAAVAESIITYIATPITKDQAEEVVARVGCRCLLTTLDGLVWNSLLDLQVVDDDFFNACEQQNLTLPSSF